jgi:hypothetical protein
MHPEMTWTGEVMMSMLGMFRVMSTMCWPSKLMAGESVSIVMPKPVPCMSETGMMGKVPTMESHMTAITFVAAMSRMSPMRGVASFTETIMLGEVVASTALVASISFMTPVSLVISVAFMTEFAVMSKVPAVVFFMATVTFMTIVAWVAVVCSMSSMAETAMVSKTVTSAMSFVTAESLVSWIAFAALMILVTSVAGVRMMSVISTAKSFASFIAAASDFTLKARTIIKMPDVSICVVLLVAVSIAPIPVRGLAPTFVAFVSVFIPTVSIVTEIPAATTIFTSTGVWTAISCKALI